MIILPENWITPSGLTFTPSTRVKEEDQLTLGVLEWNGSLYMNSLNTSGENFAHNTYTATQWDKMQANGAVFLPAAGNRVGTNVVSLVGSCGEYWSATPPPYIENNAYCVVFNKYQVEPQNFFGRKNGCSVRLVKDYNGN